jgi:hypothetical protein
MAHSFACRNPLLRLIDLLQQDNPVEKLINVHVVRQLVENLLDRLFLHAAAPFERECQCLLNYSLVRSRQRILPGEPAPAVAGSAAAASLSVQIRDKSTDA